MNPGSFLATVGVAAFSLALYAWQGAEAQENVLELTAAADSVGRADRPIRISVFRWSSAEERDAVVTAWTAPDTAPAVATDEGGRGGGGGPGGFGGGGRGNDDAEPEPVTPIEAVTATIEQAPTLGYVWTDGPAGHSVKYAVRSSLADGGERIVLAARPRLDAYSNVWTATASAAPTDYGFTLIELRVGDDGGEGRTSLTTAITLEDATGTLVLDDFAAAPVVFDDVTRSP